MTGIDSMADFLEKGGLPEGDHSNLKKPKSSAVGGSADGGELEGVGMTSGEAPLVGGQIPKVSPGKTEKLSEDDEDVERQMSPHKKPIETTRKSALPADQRDSVAHAQAVAVSRLRKSAGERQLSADEAAAELVKGDGFYHGAAPSLDLHQTVDLKSIQACPECEETFSKSLTACPSCGAGAVVSRPLPVMPQNQAVDPSRGLLRKSRNEADVRIGSVEPVQMTSQNGILIRR